MAAGIPAALKSADVARFAQRAGQVEKAKPSVAYWCNYWIVNQLISRGLHNVDDDCTRYTTDLMDKLEKTKMEHGEDDTIIDDIAAQVYVEQFALETFQRAENAMRANKASRQTADTLLAAAVFLELRQIWEPLDPETSSKVKYAKYHALRIAKAIKAREDPNLTNPTQEAIPSQGPSMEPQDPDAPMVEETPTQPAAYQPTVEEIPDEYRSSGTDNAQEPAADKSQHPSRAPPVPPQQDEITPTPRQTVITAGEVENYYQHPSVPDISPLQSPERGRNGSIGGGYFPRAPDADHPYEQTPVVDGGADSLNILSSPTLPDPSSLPPRNPFSSPDPPIPPADSFRSFPLPGIDQNAASTWSAPAKTPRYPQPTAPSGMPQPHTAATHRAAPVSFSPSLQHSNASHTVSSTFDAIWSLIRMSGSEDGLGTVSSRSRWSPTPERDHSDDEELFFGDAVDNRDDQDHEDEASQGSVSEYDHGSTSTITAARYHEHKFDAPADQASTAPFKYTSGVHETSSANKVNKGKKTSEVLNPERQILPSTLKQCLKALGFRMGKGCAITRNAFQKDLKKWAKARGNQRLRPHTNQDAFDNMVEAFLNEYGEKYFGSKNRQHLQEEDPAEGILWPRDESKLTTLVSRAFELKAKIFNKYHGEIDKLGSLDDVTATKHPSAASVTQDSLGKRSSSATITGQPKQKKRHLDSMPTSRVDENVTQPCVSEGPTEVDLATVKPALGTSNVEESAPKVAEDVSKPPPSQGSLEPHSATTRTAGSISDVKIDPESAAKPKVTRVEPSENTYMIVTATTQSDLAPVHVPFRSDLASEDLFALLAEECELASEVVGNIRSISVTFAWDAEPLRLRKGKQADIKRLHDTVRTAWGLGPSQFQGGYKIKMLLHVVH
ncbi:MAG: hypothetical protein Q9225_007787 [Loekoesia sp. 1 TL-2023]